MLRLTFCPYLHILEDFLIEIFVTIASPRRAGALLFAACDNEAGEECKFLKIKGQPTGEGD